MKTFKPVPKFSFLLFIILVECIQLTVCLNMWTSLEQKQASNKTPVKRCTSPCRIFHSWCKNEGKCREKGQDCTWYCECPSNCEGFFCEKKVDATAIGGGQSVEVKVTYEKEKKQPVSAFDKSKLAQALAGIFLKEKQTDEEKKPTLPDSIDRVGKTINTKENVTTKVIINCPPGDLYQKKNQSTDSKTTPISGNDSNTQNNSNIESKSVSRPTENTALKDTHNVTTNAPEHLTVVKLDASHSTSIQSTAKPLVKSSFSVTSSTIAVTEVKNNHNTTVKPMESHTYTQSQGSTLHTTTDSSTQESKHVSLESLSGSHTEVSRGEKKILTSSTMFPTTIKITESQVSIARTQADSTSTTTTEQPQTIKNKNSKDVTPPVENSLYIKNTEVRKTSHKADMLNIIEKAIEVEYFTTTPANQPSTSSIKTTTESTHTRKNKDLTTESVTVKEKTTTDQTLSNNKLTNSTKLEDTTRHNTTPQTKKNKTFLATTTSPIGRSTISANSTTAKTTHVTQTVNDLIEHNTSVSSNRTNTQFDNKLKNMVEPSITNQSLKEQNVNGNSQIKNTTNLMQPNTSNKGDLTKKETKSEQITAGHETLHPLVDVSKQTNPKSTTPQVERPIYGQTTNVISETSSTTIFKSKLDTTTTATTAAATTTTTATAAATTAAVATTTTTTAAAAAAAKIKTRMTTDASSSTTAKTKEFSTTEKLIPANAKSYLSKQKVTENSKVTNKSTHDTTAIGEINTLSSTNVPPVNLSDVITMSHDLPKNSEVDMSTVQTVMSKVITTEQQISNHSAENIKVKSTSLPKMKEVTQPSPPQTEDSSSKETSTAAPTSIISNQPSQKVKSNQTANTQTTGNSGMIKKQTELPYSVREAIEKTTATSKSDTIKQTTPVAYNFETVRHQSTTETLNKTSSNKVQISTSHNHQTTTEQTLTVPPTTPEDITLNTGTTRSAPSTTVNVSNPEVVETSSTTVSGTKKTVTGVTQTHVNGIDSTSNKADTNVLPSVANDTGQQKDKFTPSTESVTQTGVTTKAPHNGNDHTTGSVIYSAGIGEPKMPLTKAFFDSKSDFLKKSKVKNELLSNKLGESVKDLKFDLLKMGLRDKGLPSDLDNIL